MSSAGTGRIAASPADHRFNLGRLMEAGGLLIFFVLTLVVAAVLSPHFLQPDNIRNVLTQAAPLGIVAVAQAFPILLRGLDLSVASVMATSAVLATSFETNDNRMLPVMFAASLVLGLAVGLLNGFLVAKRRVSPFLATLATMIVLQGLRFVYTKGAPGGTLPSGFQVIGQDALLGIPINFLALLILTAVLAFVLHRSPYGRKVYIVGGNPRAATLVGINADRITISGYMISGAVAAMAGLFLVGYVGMVDNWTGKGFELDSIVACVMGGIAISGGRGSVFGALLGVLILTVLFNIVILLGLPVQVQYIIKGIIIIVASAFYLKRARA
jgi:ribose/xylose/arabinose/galactoside ABC-type transport system permease subunit